MHRILLLSLLSLLSISSTFAQDFKVVGYLPYYRFGLLDQMELEKLTHLNIAFLNPGADGNLQLPSGDIKAVIEQGHAAGVEVFIALAGGYLQPDWEAAWNQWMKPANRSEFIHKIINYSLEHQVQGIDVDLEWQYVNELYSGFVIELGDSLRAHNLQMSAALPGTYRYPEISSQALAAFDWVNMMVYDLRGPWDPSNAGPHSPMSFAYQSIAYWKNQGVSVDRLTLGVPFYGYDFSDPTDVRAYTYRTILSWNIENANKDQAGQTYYNGMATIEAKAALALEELSGIMIWEIGQDDFGDYSLLDVIHSKVMVTSVRGAFDELLSVQAFPNPFVDQLQIQAESPIQIIHLIDPLGRVIQEWRPQGALTTQLQLSNLLSGVYYLRIQTDRIQTLQLIKS